MSGSVSRLERTVGRYVLFGAIGAGGMASVHLGRRVGAGGFARLVAIKRLHPHLAADREVVHSFLDEARIAARVTHPNVVSIHDVVLDGDEVLLVMDYVAGASLARLAGAERRVGRAVPPAIAIAITLDLLRGLQAAHDARDERGRPLHVVHRDVSPHNLLVGSDGVSRVLDFGIAKALGCLHTTATGAIKGKLAYMAPERLRNEDATASVDMYAAAIVAWELLAGARYFDGAPDEAMVPRVMAATYRHLDDVDLGAVDAVLARALAREPSHRHASASALAAALAAVHRRATPEEVAAWVEGVAGAELARRAEEIEEVEQSSVPSPEPASKGPSTSEAAPTVREPGPSASEAAPTVREPGDTSAPVVSHAPPEPARARPGLRALGLATGIAALAVVAMLVRGSTHVTTTGARAASASATEAVVEPPPLAEPLAPVAPLEPAPTETAPLRASGPGRPRRAPAASASASNSARAQPPAPASASAAPEAPVDRK